MKAKTTLIVIASVFLVAPQTFAAKKQPLRFDSPASRAIQQHLEIVGLARPYSAARPVDVFTAAIRAALHLPANQTLRIVDSNIDPATGERHIKYRQFYKGVPLLANRFVVTQRVTGKVRWLHGNLVTGISHDVDSVVPQFGKQEALSIARLQEAVAKPPSQPRVYRYTSANLEIWLDKQKKAHLVWVVTWFSDIPAGGQPARPVYFVDANSGQVLHHFEGLMTASALGTGPGGNEKTGEYYYGTDRTKFEVSVSSGLCSMDTGQFKVVDSNNSASSAYSFWCYANDPNSETNGAFSPLNDADAFADTVYNMYDDWYGVAPISFKIAVKVHYGSGWANSAWDGHVLVPVSGGGSPPLPSCDCVMIGDGNSNTYPLVVLDVVSHEISHGFTQYHSGLIYDGQSGAINESFSDMAGEAAESYSPYVPADFEPGKYVKKGSGSLRYMCTPTLDGNSIDNAFDYTDGMDVHYASGVFNKAFCKIAKSSGWTIHTTFELFVKANENDWTPNSTFQEAAQSVYDKAWNGNYSNTDAVHDAFSDVGLNVPPLTMDADICRYNPSLTTTYEGYGYHCCPEMGAFYRDDMSCPLGFLDERDRSTLSG